MHDGEIFANPFEMRFPQNQPLIWVVENRKTVERIISETLHSNKVRWRGVEVSDCYYYILEKFTDASTEGGYNTLTPLLQQEVDLASYCLVRIRKLTRLYANRRLKELRSHVPIVKNAEFVRDAYFKGVIDETIAASTDSQSIELALEDPDAEWQEADMLFTDLCEAYKDYFFIEKGYIAFDLEKYFTYMFFHSFSEMLPVHMEKAAEAAEIHYELLSLVTINLRQDLEKDNFAAKAILSTIKDLHSEQKQIGWKPRLVRDYT